MGDRLYDFDIETLGEAKLQSPIRMSHQGGDGMADYVKDEDKVLYSTDTEVVDGRRQPVHEDAMEVAGPREKIYFNPSHVHAAICTCGGICPGLNNVIRAVVRCFWYRYGVRRISGIQYGYLGLLENSSWPLIPLDPDVVDDIQEKGGTILGSARGGGKQVEEIVDSLERLNINILITIGGDGTLRGAYDIGEEIRKRGLKIAVVGVPKTIDNDLSFIDSSFGFDTAVASAVPSVRGAHVEAKNSINGIGLVKVMGRESGFIAAHTSLAQSDVNFCLIPESPFDLDGPNGLLENLKRRILERGHAVILVAEGAGQEFAPPTGETDHLPEGEDQAVFQGRGHPDIGQVHRPVVHHPLGPRQQLRLDLLRAPWRPCGSCGHGWKDQMSGQPRQQPVRLPANQAGRVQEKPCRRRRQPLEGCA